MSLVAEPSDGTASDFAVWAFREVGNPPRRRGLVAPVCSPSLAATAVYHRFSLKIRTRFQGSGQACEPLRPTGYSTTVRTMAAATPGPAAPLHGTATLLTFSLRCP